MNNLPDTTKNFVQSLIELIFQLMVQNKVYKGQIEFTTEYESLISFLKSFEREKIGHLMSYLLRDIAAKSKERAQQKNRILKMKTSEGRKGYEDTLLNFEMRIIAASYMVNSLKTISDTLIEELKPKNNIPFEKVANAFDSNNNPFDNESVNDDIINPFNESVNDDIINPFSK